VPYLIDGNNILGTWRGASGSEDRRPEVLRRVSEFCRTQGARAVLAFDGEPFRNGMPRQDLGLVSVRFPESGEDADTLIRRIVAAEAHPEEILVVTSDKALYSWCKTRGARALRAHEWNALAGRPPRSRSPAEKPDRETDVEGWLRAFGADPEGDERGGRTDDRKTD
jgi:predicted RNA-binding protein with PIN domain